MIKMMDWSQVCSEDDFEVWGELLASSISSLLFEEKPRVAEAQKE
jgi:hypothetical protein